MPETATPLAELKVPARKEFIGLAKRVATSLGVQLGFSLDEIDELGIAVVQACGTSIEYAEESWGGGATLKLAYTATDRGMAVEFEAVAPESEQALPLPKLPVRERSADVEAQRALMEAMIRLLVDDFRHQVDSRRRHIRYRMVKYLVS